MQTCALRTRAFAGAQFRPVAAPAGPSRRQVVVQAVQDLQGVVVSAATNKTIVVRVDRFAPHAEYGKRMRQSKRYTVHDEEEKAKIGDFVRLSGTKPMSKTKRFALAEIVKPASN